MKRKLILVVKRAIETKDYLVLDSISTYATLQKKYCYCITLTIEEEEVKYLGGLSVEIKT